MGGNSLGLYGAVFGPSGDYVLAHGYQGEFHLWKKVTSGNSKENTFKITRVYKYLEVLMWIRVMTILSSK